MYACTLICVQYQYASTPKLSTTSAFDYDASYVGFPAFHHVVPKGCAF